MASITFRKKVSTWQVATLKVATCQVQFFAQSARSTDSMTQKMTSKEAKRAKTASSPAKTASSPAKTAKTASSPAKTASSPKTKTVKDTKDSMKRPKEKTKDSMKRPKEKTKDKKTRIMMDDIVVSDYKRDWDDCWHNQDCHARLEKVHVIVTGGGSWLGGGSSSWFGTGIGGSEGKAAMNDFIKDEAGQYAVAAYYQQLKSGLPGINKPEPNETQAATLSAMCLDAWLTATCGYNAFAKRFAAVSGIVFFFIVFLLDVMF